jgi:hypothetical protein
MESASARLRRWRPSCSRAPLGSCVGASRLGLPQTFSRASGRRYDSRPADAQSRGPSSAAPHTTARRDAELPASPEDYARAAADANTPALFPGFGAMFQETAWERHFSGVARLPCAFLKDLATPTLASGKLFFTVSPLCPQNRLRSWNAVPSEKEYGLELVLRECST